MLTRRHFLQQSLAASAALSLPGVLRGAEREAALTPDAMAVGFANPPRSCAPIPWWMWDGDMDLVEMERQIQEIAKCGVRGFYIFGLTGLKMEYLGEDYMLRVRWTVKRAVELGLEPWIYDDFDWPSGLSKDQVIQRQELRQRGIFAETRRVQGRAVVTVPMPKGELVVAAAVPRREGEIAVSEVRDLTVQCGVDALVWEAPAGEWDVFIFTQRVIEGASFVDYYVDVFNPEASRYFIELTHEAYKRALGPELFKHIRGFFSDEPFFLNRDAGTPSETPLASAPWSPVLRAALGAPLLQTLVAVFGDADRAGRKVRRDFWDICTRLFAENFYAQRAKWCAQHGMVLTGHEGGWISGGGDYARTLRSMQMPGMDWLGIARAEYAVRIIEAKLVSSLARHTGRQAMMEGPGVFTWQQKLADLRQSCDTFALYGFQSFTLNGFHYTVEGHRYYSPSAMFYQATFWPLMASLMRYSSRMVWALMQGTIPARVAVLWSPESVWSDERATSGQFTLRQKRRRPEDEWQRGVEAVMSALLARQIEFGVVDTMTLLDQATIVDGMLSVGPMQYEVLIIPPTHALPLDTMTKLAAFHAGGGKLIAVGALPTEADAPAHDEPLVKYIAQLFGKDVAAHDWSAYLKRDAQTVAMRESGPHSWFAEVSMTNANEVLPELLGTLITRLVDRAWSLDGESRTQIFATERVLPDGRFIFLVNASDDEAEADLRLDAPALIERWDMLSGATAPYRRQQSPTHAALKLIPREAMLLRLDSSKKWMPSTRHVISKRRLPDRWHFGLLQGNCAFPTPTWETSTRVISPTTTLGYRYRVEFPVTEKPQRIALLIDNSDVHFHSGRVRTGYECTINGALLPMSALGYNQTFDRRMREFDLTAQVRVGNNEVILEYQHCSWLGAPVLPSMQLIGMFAIKDGAITKATERGETAAVSWTELGYPHFSGSAVYRQEIQWSATQPNTRVLLRAEDVRDHARFRVNGQPAGDCPWAPWEADITALLKSGTNVIEIAVINTNANFFALEIVPSGLIGPVTLVVLNERP